MTWILEKEEIPPTRRGAHPQYAKARDRVAQVVKQHQLHLQEEMNAGRLDSKADLEFSYWAAVENLAPPRGFRPEFLPAGGVLRCDAKLTSEELEQVGNAWAQAEYSPKAVIVPEGWSFTPGTFIGWKKGSDNPAEMDEFIPLFEPIEVKVRFRPRWVP